MKKLLSLLFIALLLLLPMSLSAAEGQAAAENLHALGLLAGVGKNADGSVNFDVGGKLTRAQAITQIVRFLGAEKTATASTYTHPFTDLPAWAVPYVGYAFENGITKGVSATKFGTDDRMGDAAFLTLILRVLGYKDAEGDFVWNNPYTLAKTAGLIDSETPDGDFTRGDAFAICYRALTATVKSGDSVKEQLIAKSVFTAEQFAALTGEGEKVLYRIGALNTDSVEGSHAADDIATASMEMDYRQRYVLNSGTMGHYRFDTAFYPRIKKINDSLYVMFFMQGQTGPNLFYATSADGVHWNVPEVLYNIADYVFKYSYGEKVGVEDKIIAANADAVLLPNGELLCAYCVRPAGGYQPYPELSGIVTRRAKITENNTLEWGEPQKVYSGQCWEPFIYLREDGEVQILWSSPVAYLSRYGYDDDMRSAGVLMIRSTDNGFTWTPAVTEDDQNHFEALRVFNQYLGTKVHTKRPDLGAIPYFGGQMPAVVTLLDGRALLAAEVRILDFSFTIATYVSGADGAWTVHDYLQPTENSDPKDNFPGMGPYLARFPSGEVLLSYTRSRAPYFRMISPDGATVGRESPSIDGSYGEWGAIEAVSGHEVICVQEHRGDTATSILMQHAYLNHRINAKRVSVRVDGYTGEWAESTDALFVGSETQAQMSVQAAHDSDNIYFLISRLDEYLTDGDAATLNLGVGKSSYYRIKVGMAGILSVEYVEGGAVKRTVEGGKAVVTTFGTLNNDTDKDEGISIELSIPKAALGITDSFTLSPVLANQDGIGTVSDGLEGVSPFLTERWPAVVLD